MNTKLVCVGGPCHGQIIDRVRPFIEVPVDPLWQQLHRELDFSATFLRTRYRFEMIQACIGGLHLTGEFYVWDSIRQSEDVLRAAWAMMLAANVKEF